MAVPEQTEAGARVAVRVLCLNQRFLYHNGEKWLIWNVMDDRLEPPRPIHEVLRHSRGLNDDERYWLFREEYRGLRCGSMTLMLERKSPCSRGWTIIREWCFPRMVHGDFHRLGQAGSGMGCKPSAFSHVLTGHKRGCRLYGFSYDGEVICTLSPMERFVFVAPRYPAEMVHFTLGCGCGIIRFQRQSKLLLIWP